MDSKKIEEQEKRIGMPLDVFLSILLQDNCIYGIVNGEIEEILVEHVSGECYFDDNRNLMNDVRLYYDDFCDCGYSTLSYNEDFFLSEEAAEKALKEKLEKKESI